MALKKPPAKSAAQRQRERTARKKTGKQVRRGEPSRRDDALVDEILARHADGEPLAVICREEGKPSLITLRRWCKDDEDLALRYQAARDSCVDQIAADVLRISDGLDYEGITDERYTQTGTGVNDRITRDRLRVETRMKLIGKWDPKRYGDKLGLVGGDGEGPVGIQKIADDKLAMDLFNTLIAAGLTEDQAQATMNKLAEDA